MTDPFDQSLPVRPGYRRIPGFMDVAEYDDAIFQEYAKHDLLLAKHVKEIGVGPASREAVFNSSHLEDSGMAIAWNEFVEKRRKKQVKIEIIRKTDGHIELTRFPAVNDEIPDIEGTLIRSPHNFWILEVFISAVPRKLGGVASIPIDGGELDWTKALNHFESYRLS